MTIGSSYALDKETAANIKRLAKGWGVSQAEVIRRSIRRAAEQEGPTAMTPAEVVAHYAAGPAVRPEESLDTRVSDSGEPASHLHRAAVRIAFPISQQDRRSGR
ncbi:MAG: ribbon-helix-helix protein, CopG family [Wenzhouxiangella sp.]|nr:ribbon-helix-helix protein, CopG family [Wenzhouxiangella sp.]